MTRRIEDTKPKKVQKKKMGTTEKVVLILSVILFPFVIYKAITDTSSEQRQTEADSQTAAPTIYKWKSFSPDDEIDCSNAYFCLIAKSRNDDYLRLRYIDGAIGNQTGKRLNYLAITFGLYVDDTKVGSCFTNTNFIDAGGSYEFSALCSGGEDRSVTYKVDDITYW